MASEAPANVLLVSPDPDTLDRLKKALHGFACLCTHDEGHALDYLGGRSFHVAITDGAFPAHSTIDFMRSAWALSPWTEFIVLAEPSDDRLPAKAAAVGASMCLRKPITGAQVRLAVEKTLERLSLASTIFRMKVDSA